MEFIGLAVGLLFVLAIVDLSVGVSNDAVNFLNSAIGSRAGSLRLILIIASVGIIVGASASSGMMEVARKGIFNPGMFSFADVIVIFLAVMIADVVLLDAFNTLALPTSTTVSIVFELLGAATAVALIVAMGNPTGPSLQSFINVNQAVVIIAGIFLSVGVAFGIGLGIQFVTRLVFTFRSGNLLPGILSVWAGLALTVLVFFLFFKGLKGAVFLPPEFPALIGRHLPLVVGITLTIGIVASRAMLALGVDVLRIVVLLGTFSLAMAFASNDLVNFVGVPLAGLSAWQTWRESGLPADEMSMGALANPIRGGTLWLLGAGAIMVLTLWVSTKARAVTRTEVNLARQEEGDERFAPGVISRILVRSWLAVARAGAMAIPDRVRSIVDRRFRASTTLPQDAAFDKMRASVNLVVASALIAAATSMKLPLSTTYVSFMVAMGTSLADRAWGKDSAVYRVAGVLSVIGGWLLTAFIAFTVAGLLALAMKLLGLSALWGIVCGAVLLLLYSRILHAAREGKVEHVARLRNAPRELEPGTMMRLRAQLSQGLKAMAFALQAVARRERGLIVKAAADLDRHRTLAIMGRERLIVAMRRSGSRNPPLMAIFAHEQDLLQSVECVVNTAREFVLNLHELNDRPVTDALESWADAGMHAAASLADGTSPSDLEFTELQKLQSCLSNAVVVFVSAGDRSIRNASHLLGLTVELADFLGAAAAAVSSSTSADIGNVVPPERSQTA